MNYSTDWHTRSMWVTVEDCSAVQWKERRAVRHAWDDAASHQRGTNKWHSPTWILLRQEATRDWPVVSAASTAMECPWGRHRKAVGRGSYLTCWGVQHLTQHTFKDKPPKSGLFLPWGQQNHELQYANRRTNYTKSQRKPENTLTQC